MNYNQLAKDILNHVGGEENIISLVHCATRLRFTLNDNKKTNISELEKLEGVIAVVNKVGQFQVVIGNDVPYVYREIVGMSNIEEKDAGEPEEKKKILDVILDTIAGIFTPILPAITAAGLLKALLIIMPLLGILSNDSSTYKFLNIVADAPFYYFPIIIAFTSAKKFGCNPYLAVVLGAIMLHPSYGTLVASKEAMTFFGLPVPGLTYGSSVIPIILSVWAMKYVEIFADKISPKVLKYFLKPMIVFLIMAPIIFVAIGPLGIYIGIGFAKIIYMIQDKIGWLAVVIMGVLMPFIVMVGMQKAFIPVMITALANPGYEMLIAPAMLASNIAQGAATLVVGFKTKNLSLKQLSISSGISALLAGITEPAMYGVTLKHKKVMISSMIGAGVGSLYMGITGVAAYTYAMPSLLTLPACIGGGSMYSFKHAIIGTIITIIVTVVSTYLLYKEEETIVKNEKTVKIKSDEELIVASPLNGIIKSLTEVNDPVFSSGVMGDGIAILPKEGELYAPIDGVVIALYPSKHAIGIKGKNDLELLMHIGVDTVSLEGKYFEAFVEQGQSVKKGDLLIKFDINKITENGYDIITPVIITNTKSYDKIEKSTKVDVHYNDTLLKIK